MESWGFQVRSGETLKAYPKIGRVIHITQVHLLDSEEEEKRTGLIRVKLGVGASDFVMASLSPEDFPVVSCKYLFTKPFELSHDSKTRSLYFSGYTDDDIYGLRDNSHALSTIDEPQVEKFQSYVKSNAGKLKSGTKLKGNGSDDSAQLDDSECPQNDDKVAPMKLKSVKKSSSEDR